MKWLLALLTLLLLLLQYKLWVGDGGVPSVLQLQQDVEKQQVVTQQLEERNAALEAEVEDLKKGLDAIEERSRREMGMVGKDEEFYQIINKPPADKQNAN